MAIAEQFHLRAYLFLIKLWHLKQTKALGGQETPSVSCLPNQTLIPKIKYHRPILMNFYKT